MRLLALCYRPSHVWGLSGSERRFLRIFGELDGRVTLHTIQTPPRFVVESAIDLEQVLVPVSQGGPLGHALAEWITRGMQTAERVSDEVGGVDAIYATNNNLFNLGLASLLARRMSLPLAVVAHHLRWVDYRSGSFHFDFPTCLRRMRHSGLGILEALQRTSGAALEHRLLQRADLLLTVSSAVARSLLATAPGVPVAVTGNGVDPAPNRRTVSHQRGALYVGRIDEGKGVLDLIRLWAQVVGSGTQARLRVVGNGFLASRAMNLVQKKGLQEWVLFAGFVGDARLNDMYARSHLFVTMSTTEGWGLSIGEALAAGLPVVAYDIPPLREVWGECEAVTLVPVGDLGGAADSIRRLLSLDASSYEDLRKAARSYVRRYPWREVAERERRALSDLVDAT